MVNICNETICCHKISRTSKSVHVFQLTMTEWIWFCQLPFFLVDCVVLIGFLLDVKMLSCTPKNKLPYITYKNYNNNQSYYKNIFKYCITNLKHIHTFGKTCKQFTIGHKSNINSEKTLYLPSILLNLIFLLIQSLSLRKILAQPFLWYFFYVCVLTQTSSKLSQHFDSNYLLSVVYVIIKNNIWLTFYPSI